MGISTLKQKLGIFSVAAVTLVSFGTIKVQAEGENEAKDPENNTPAAEVIETSDEDLTPRQYYFGADYGVVFPGWNSYDGDGKPVPNVDPEKKIVVAVLDHGVDYNHEDLKNVMWDEGENYDELKQLGGGKYGINTTGVGDSSDPMDDNGHGTKIAGIIGAEWNGKGISGALSGVKIMAVRSMSENPKTQTKWVVDGLKYVLAAKRAGVNVAAVNVSWNGSAQYSDPESMQDVIFELGKENVVVVFAAGNYGQNIDDVNCFSNYFRNSANVIVTGASDHEKNFYTKLSNYGRLNVDVLAPGEDLLTTEYTVQPSAEGNSSDAETAGSTEPDGSGEPAQAETETPVVSNKYVKESGTSMSAPIVTALAAYLYDKCPDLKDAGSRAARIIETSEILESAKDKIAGGFVNPAAASAESPKTRPLPNYGELAGGILTIHGFDFGGKEGTLKIDGEETPVRMWLDNKILVEKNIPEIGTHTVTVIRKDKESFERIIQITGTNEDAEQLPTDGVPGMVVGAVTAADSGLYLFGRPYAGTNAFLYAYDSTGKKWKELKLSESASDFIPKDSCAVDGALYYIRDAGEELELLKVNPKDSEKAVSVTIPLNGMVTDPRIASIDNRTIVSYTIERENSKAVVIAECGQSDAGPVLTELCSITEENTRCLDVVKTGEKILAVCEKQGSEPGANTSLVVYELITKEDTVTAEETFREDGGETDTYHFAGAAGSDSVLAVYGVSGKSGAGSVLQTVEYDVETGKAIRTVNTVGGNINSFCGSADSENIYLAGSSSSVMRNPFVIKAPISEVPGPTPTPTITPTPSSDPTPTPTITPTPSSDPTPTPTITPTPSSDPTPTPTVTPTPTAKPTPSSEPTPTPTVTPTPSSKPAPTPTVTPTPTPAPTSTPEPTVMPTATPAPTEAPASDPVPAPTAPVSTVVTCQDAGFPAGWYWNESKKACVAPMTPSPAQNNSGGNGTGGNTGSGTVVRPANNGNTNSGTLTPEPTQSAEPSETPEITPTPTVTPTPTATPEEIQPPMEIINTKGILWFLGIPVLMILTGLGIYLTGNRGLIPWLIAGDAIGSVVLAILDHSIVGWILVVLNLAAIGLLALYRSGKQEEEDEEFEDE